MKKTLKLLICSLLLSVLVFSTTVCAYDPLTDRSYERFGKNVLFVEDADNPQQIDMDMLNYVEAVTPSVVLELFKQEGVRVYLTHSVNAYERLSSSGNGYNARCYPATISYNTSTQKIASVSSPIAIYIYSDTQSADAYIHECGHAIDFLEEYITGYYKGQKPISSSAEWQTLYAKYAGTMATFDAGAATNVPRSACEGFAEAYRLYFSYSQKLLNTCPEVYAFVSEQLINCMLYLKPVTYENFDYITYCYNYPDVYEAFGLDKDALWNHYITSGKAEGRIATRVVE